MNELLFRSDNTDGYTATELDALNREADLRVPELMASGLSEDEARKAFADEVAQR